MEQRIKGTTGLLALIGSPVGHSGSPAMYNFSFPVSYTHLDVYKRQEDSDLIRNLNMYVVNQFYRKPYDGNRDFYEQFYERLAAGKELLSLGM